MVVINDAAKSARFLRILGDELRLARKRQRWRRRDLRDKLNMTISVQALATYELGTRAITVARLLELAEVLEISMPDLLARAVARFEGQTVDLFLLANTQRSELYPLRGWARARLAHMTPHEPTVIRLNRSSLHWLAQLSGLSPTDLIIAIRQASGS
jgi:transcriptional regulator with XRE-family HTH domain